MHVDPSAPDTLTFAPANGTNFIAKWVDVEHGQTHLAKTTTQYQFAKRSVGTPYVSTLTQNNLPLVDFGVYTSELYPDGNGGAFAPSLALTEESGLRNFFVIWGDYEEIADLPLYNGKELRGPGILAGSNGWGYRGFGGGGNTYPILTTQPNGSYHTSAGSSIRIDGVAHDFTDKTFYYTRPEKGFHVLDQQVGGTSPTLHWVGGCKWQNGYVGGGGSGVHPGVWGGVRMGEILIYRKLLPAYFRDRIADMLGTKWFNRTNSLAYTSVTVAPGASLAWPSTWVETAALSLGGTLAAEEIVAREVTLTGAATVNGRAVIEDGGTVSVPCRADGTAPSLSADAFTLAGEAVFAFTFEEDDVTVHSGVSHRLVTGVGADFSVGKIDVVLPAAAKARGFCATLSVREGALYVDFAFPGLSILIY